MSEAREAAFTAVDEGDVEALTALLRTDPTLVSARGEGGVTLLHLAAERDEAGAARVLIEHGADVQAGDFMGGGNGWTTYVVAQMVGGGIFWGQAVEFDCHFARSEVDPKNWTSS